MKTWDDLSGLAKLGGLIFAIITGLIAGVVWHYSEFQTLAAFETYAAYEQQQDNQRLIFDIEKQRDEYEQQLMNEQNPKKIEWLKAQIEKLNKKIECLRAGNKVC